ncbi:hypothetical protein Cgig2_003127 [Carnegiea gigantea]|uniref:Uncharacterized protein n=1 Tax=Carnegiea gigantea TaxID=171969 RepID=A0A9Q1GXJ5_9CARY|nr:hypothetical protein Cgig2_003127 [Carnegiea gigantea]
MSTPLPMPSNTERNRHDTHLAPGFDAIQLSPNGRASVEVADVSISFASSLHRRRAQILHGYSMAPGTETVLVCMEAWQSLVCSLKAASDENSFGGDAALIPPETGLGLFLWSVSQYIIPAPKTKPPWPSPFGVSRTSGDPRSMLSSCRISCSNSPSSSSLINSSRTPRFAVVTCNFGLIAGLSSSRVSGAARLAANPPIVLSVSPESPAPPPSTMLPFSASVVYRLARSLEDEDKDEEEEKKKKKKDKMSTRKKKKMERRIHSTNFHFKWKPILSMISP